MLKILQSKKFRKDFKRIRHDPAALVVFRDVVLHLQAGQALALHYHDHRLIGNEYPNRECHLKPDLLLIYRIHPEEQLLELIRIGSHSHLRLS